MKAKIAKSYKRLHKKLHQKPFIYRGLGAIVTFVTFVTVF